MWRVTSYRVDAERLRVNTGVIWRKRLALRRERIRSVDLTADPVLRMLGAVTVRVGTGEQAGAEGTVTLWPLPRASADALRTALLAHAAHPDDPDGPEVSLARFDRRWIRFAPLSFLTPTLGAAAAGGTLQVAEWFGMEDRVITAVGSWFGLAPVLLVALALGVGLLLVGGTATLALWVESWWNHTLDRRADGTLHVRRGLLTTRSISLEESRLRGVEVVEALGARLAGGARVDCVATGLTTGEEDKTESRTLLPTAPKELAGRVAAKVLREPISPTTAALTPHPTTARGRRLRWALSTVVATEAVVVVLGLVLTPMLLHVAWLSALVLVPVATLLALDAYRALGHTLAGAYLVTRSGTVRRATVALRRDGIVGWTVRQSLLQRRAGLVTVVATTAAGSGAYAVRDAAQGDGLAMADAAVPSLLRPFLARADDGVDQDAMRA